MRDPRHILLDDGTIVENRGCVVAGGADELDSARMRRVIGPCPGERGQKRMVHIDDRRRILRDERWRKNLHVPRKDYELDAVLFQQFTLLRLGG